MWVKCDAKTIFLNIEKHFLNFGHVDEEKIKKWITDPKGDISTKLPLPKNMIFDIQKAFDILDRHEKGVLGHRDIKVTLRAMGIEPTTKQIKKMIERTSSDKRSEVSREEYEEMIGHILNDIDSDEQLIYPFRAFDINDQGYLTFTDVKKVSEELNIDVADEEIEEMIKLANGRGVSAVNFEEFVTSARKTF